MTKTLAVLVRRVAGALRDHRFRSSSSSRSFQIVVTAAALSQSRQHPGRAALRRSPGLTLFIQGLESGLFPLGEAIAQGFARKGSATAPVRLRLLPRFRHHDRGARADCGGGGGGPKLPPQAGAIADDDAGARRLRVRAAHGGGVLGRGGHRARRPAHPEGLADPPADHRRLRARDDHDRLRPRRDHRGRLRFRRRHHQHHHGTAGDRARSGARRRRSGDATP